MTNVKIKKGLKFRLNAFRLIVILFGALCLIYSEPLKESILYGIRLCAIGIIPSLFPFFVISDYLYYASSEGDSGSIAKGLGKLLGISPKALF